MFIEKVKCIDWKDIAERALKTFLQAFISSITIDSIFEVTTMEGLKSVLVSMLIAAMASAVSVTWNFVTNYVAEQIINNDELEASIPDEESEEISNG